MLIPPLAFWSYTPSAAAPTGLLDSYPGAAGAWSLRSLSSNTTNVIRMRRDSDDAEQDFTPEEITDGTLTTFTGAGNGFVVTIYDQSGNGLDVNQAVLAEQPQIVSSGSVVLSNGKPSISYDGVDDSLATAATPSLADNANGFSLFLTAENIDDGFIVAQYNSGADLRVFSTETSSPRTGAGDYSFAVQVADNFDIDRVATVSVTNQVNLLTCLWGGNGTASRAAINGGTTVTAAATTPTVTSINKSLEIGASSGGGTVTKGNFQECIIYPTDKTADRLAIELDAAAYHGVTHAVTAPAQMSAPTLTGGTEEATLTLGPAASSDGGNAPIRYDYEVTDAADTGFSSVQATGQQLPVELGTPISISPLAPDDYISRQREVNEVDNDPNNWSSASTAATVTAGAMELIEPSSIDAQPVIYEPLEASLPVYSGGATPTLSAQWYRGDPATTGLAIGLETSPAPDLQTSLSGLDYRVYDPADISTLWTDTAATVPAAVGDEVHAITEKFGGSGKYVTDVGGGYDAAILRKTIDNQYYLEPKPGGSEYRRDPSEISNTQQGISFFLAADNVDVVTTASVLRVLGPMQMLYRNGVEVEAQIFVSGSRQDSADVIIPNSPASMVYGAVYDPAGPSLLTYVDGVQEQSLTLSGTTSDTNSPDRIVVANSEHKINVYGVVEIVDGVPDTQQISDIQSYFEAKFTGEANDPVADSFTYDAPTKFDYGSPLFLRYTGDDGTTTVVEDAPAPGVAGWQRVETWEGGLTDYVDSTAAQISIISDANAPSGNAVEFYGSSPQSEFYPRIERSLTNQFTTNFAEFYAVIETPPASAEFFVRFMMQSNELTNAGVGVNFSSGGAIQISDETDGPGAGGTTVLGWSVSTRYVIKCTVDGDRAEIKAFELGEAEPASGDTGTTEVFASGDFEIYGLKFGTRIDVDAGNPMKILSYSIGMLSESPSPGIQIAQAPSSDPIDYTAPTEQTSISQFDGLITFSSTENV